MGPPVSPRQKPEVRHLVNRRRPIAGMHPKEDKTEIAHFVMAITAHIFEEGQICP
jgi:hypothetical protein